VDATVASVVERFDVERAHAEADTRELLDTLVELKAIVPVLSRRR
jgi:hypothetical protein